MVPSRDRHLAQPEGEDPLVKVKPQAGVPIEEGRIPCHGVGSIVDSDDFGFASSLCEHTRSLIDVVELVFEPSFCPFDITSEFSLSEQGFLDITNMYGVEERPLRIGDELPLDSTWKRSESRLLAKFLLNVKPIDSRLRPGNRRDRGIFE